MVNGMAWQPRHWVLHSIWYGLAGMAWYMSVGGSVDTYRTRSQVEGLLLACSAHTYSSCSLWAGIVNRDTVL